MHDPKVNDGFGLIIAIALVLLLLAGGGATFMWQRQQMLAMRQEAIVQRERAEVEAARASAAAAQQPAEAAQDPAVTERPSGSGENLDSIESSVREVLQSQQRAWNSGDIDRFMDSYWKSEDLTFSSGGNLTRTWQGTLENYKKRYPSRREMGTLSCQNLEVIPLGLEAAIVLGEWQLRRESQDLGGNFTLVFRCLDDQWVIVHDHTSRAGQP